MISRSRQTAKQCLYAHAVLALEKHQLLGLNESTFSTYLLSYQGRRSQKGRTETEGSRFLIDGFRDFEYQMTELVREAKPLPFAGNALARNDGGRTRLSALVIGHCGDAVEFLRSIYSRAREQSGVPAHR